MWERQFQDAHVGVAAANVQYLKQAVTSSILNSKGLLLTQGHLNAQLER